MAADGNWNLVLNTPVDEQEATLTLKTAGDTLTGTQAATIGSAELVEGRVAGNELSWKVKVIIPFPLTITFKATIDGDTMTGSADTGLMGSFAFAGSRA